MLLLEGHVHGVHDQADVGGVLAAHGLLGDLDELDRGLVEAALVVGVAAPVRVGLLDQELALVQQALQHEVHVELAVVGVADADGDVLEIDEQGDLSFIAHASWRGAGEGVVVAIVFLFENWFSHHE